ncbi:ThiF family adenylyltransferase [Paenibacillus alkaliterrae]|uniref:ThiF family adenylyltransferase n=1 Tax=Paenibacillus alkaliterrae TaxID=320909 RepID=UPI001F36D5EF|nr:ThiF family adenylyltransferase [Paenibacillus alkaliterrae]MCF2940117.1 ThiF family adenylyltransferase [Paenibacillus alkaliterrae]
MTTKLRMSGRDHAALSRHLFPGDNKEAVALALCGAHSSESGVIITVHKIYPVPYSICEREEDRIQWPADFAVNLLNEAASKQMRILKIHSHPYGYPEFSSTDDDSDYAFFRTASEWLDNENPGVSAIMFPDLSIRARAVNGEGRFSDVESVLVAGSDIMFWKQQGSEGHIQGYAERTAQTFGEGTIRMLSELSIGVVGVSGTGSPVVELLYRTGVGELVLVDGDIIEERNLNRIFNSSMRDAGEQKAKVFVAEDAIKRSGLPTKVVPINDTLFNPDVVKRLAQCDVIFGCLDSVEGRSLLNSLSTYYCIPYFDLGIGLKADGMGGISQASGNAHYLQPGGSSLLSRKVVVQERLAAESLKRTNPAEYERRRGEGYIAGVNENSPAVISINTLIAAVAVNDFLARIHPYRSFKNDELAVISMDLVNGRMISDTPDGEPCPFYSRFVGRGDISPLLGNPGLSREGIIV